MNQQHQSVLLAGLLALALGLSGCKAMRGDSDATGTSGTGGQSATSGATGSAGASSYGSGTPTDASGNPIGSAGSSGAMGATGSMGQEQPRQGAAQRAAPNSTVLMIEPVPRSASSTGTESMTGATGTAGATGTSGSNEVYRITLRMDDGSTQVVTQDAVPDFRSGDRVNVTSGVIQR